MRILAVISMLALGASAMEMLQYELKMYRKFDKIANYWWSTWSYDAASAAEEKAAVRDIASDAYVDVCGFRGTGPSVLRKGHVSLHAQLQGSAVAARTVDFTDLHFSEHAMRATFHVKYSVDSNVVVLTGQHLAVFNADGKIAVFVAECSASDLSKLQARGRTEDGTLDLFFRMIEERNATMAGDVFASEFRFQPSVGTAAELTTLPEVDAYFETLRSVNAHYYELGQPPRRRGQNGTFMASYSALFWSDVGCSFSFTGSLFFVLDVQNRISYALNVPGAELAPGLKMCALLGESYKVDEAKVEL